ncbi:MAG: flavin reductase family protein [Desulfurococcales archaeon]|nr:flavin reductase family protein [Desulfurococcales archaeon]
MVTSKSQRGYAAFTASSVTSISLEPPLMMVSVAKGTKSHDPLVASETFLIFLLDYTMKDIAEVMAEPIDPLEKLRKVGFTESEYGPLLNRRAGYLALRKYRVYDGGDHSIVLGEIIRGELPAEPVKCPLIYHSRKYASLAECY